MIRRFSLTLAVAVLVIGSWALYHRNQIDSLDDAWQLASKQLSQLTHQAFSGSLSAPRETIRIASFALTNDQSQSPSQAAVSLLAQIVREYDLVAIQNLSFFDAEQQRQFTELLNAAGRQFTLVYAEASPGYGQRPRSAFVFDQNTVGLDGWHTYVVNDPDRVFRSPPIVGWFRTQNTTAERAFTFSLVNVQLDGRSTEELQSLGQLFRAIRSDGRGEDDVLILGELNTHPSLLNTVLSATGLKCLLIDTPTDLQLTQANENILIDPLALTEFTGHCGVFDFLKAFNLTLDEAGVVSSHLPIWAEFSVYEGGATPHVAAASRSSPSR